MRKFYVVKDEHRTTQGEIRLPERKTKHSAGYDFYLTRDLEIKANRTSEMIMLDVKAEMNPDEVLMLYVRSSLGIKKGLVLANGTGVVDSDYFENQDNDGNIGLKLLNTSNEDVTLKKGEAVIQGLFMKYLTVDEEEIVEKTREGGFGSTTVDIDSNIDALK